LRPHFHLHCLIAAGALAQDGSRWIAGGRQFLFPVRALSKMYRGKFLAGLEQLHKSNTLDVPTNFEKNERNVRRLLGGLAKKPWVVYSKAPFAGPEKMLDYLSRYTHRVAISNHRLVACDHGEVTFTYRDRTDGDRHKQARLPADQFISRFLTHVLPGRFTRIRHYGFLANRHKSRKLALIRELLGAHAPEALPATLSAEQWLQEILGIETTSCPCCGERLRQETLPPIPTASLLLRATLAVSSRQRGPPEITT